MAFWLLNANFFVSYQLFIVAICVVTQYPASLHGADTILEISELEEPEKTSLVSKGGFQKESFLRLQRATNVRAKPKVKPPAPANPASAKENENSLSNYYEGTLALTVAPCQKEGIVLMQGKANYYIKCSWNEETKDFYQVVYICRQNMRSMADAGKCIPPPDCSKCRSNNGNPVPAACPKAPECPKLPKQEPMKCPSSNPVNQDRTMSIPGPVSNGYGNGPPQFSPGRNYGSPYFPNSPSNGWPNRTESGDTGRGGTPGYPRSGGRSMIGGRLPDINLGPNALESPNGISGVPFPQVGEPGKPGRVSLYPGGGIQSPGFYGGKEREMQNKGANENRKGQDGRGRGVESGGRIANNGMTYDKRINKFMNEGERGRNGLNQMPEIQSGYGQGFPGNWQDPRFINVGKSPEMTAPKSPSFESPQYGNVPSGSQGSPSGRLTGELMFPGRVDVMPATRNSGPSVQQPTFARDAGGQGQGTGNSGNSLQNGNMKGSRGMQQQEMRGQNNENNKNQQNQFGQKSSAGVNQQSGGRVSGKSVTRVDKVTTRNHEVEEKIHVDRKEQVETLVRRIVTKGRKNKTKTVSSSVLANKQQMGSNNVLISSNQNSNQNAGAASSARLDPFNSAGLGGGGRITGPNQTPIGPGQRTQGPVAGRGSVGAPGAGKGPLGRSQGYRPAVPGQVTLGRTVPVQGQLQRPDLGRGPGRSGVGQVPSGPGVGRVPSPPGAGRGPLQPGPGRGPSGPSVGRGSLKPGAGRRPLGPGAGRGPVGSSAGQGALRLELGSAQMPPGSGQRPPGSEQRPPGSEQRPPGSGQRPPGPGQRPQGPAQRPLGPAQRPPDSVQRSPDSVQRSPPVPRQEKMPARQDPLNGNKKPLLGRGGRPSAPASYGQSFLPQLPKSPANMLLAGPPPGRNPSVGSPNAPVMRKPNQSPPLPNTKLGPRKQAGLQNRPLPVEAPNMAGSGTLNLGEVPRQGQQGMNRGSGGNRGSLQDRKRTGLEESGKQTGNALPKNNERIKMGSKPTTGNNPGLKPGTGRFAPGNEKIPDMPKEQKNIQGPAGSLLPKVTGPQLPRLPGGRSASNPSMPGNFPNRSPATGQSPKGMAAPSDRSFPRAGLNTGGIGIGLMAQNKNEMAGKAVTRMSQTNDNNQRSFAGNSLGNQTSETEEELEDETLETEIVITTRTVIFTTRREFFSSLSYESSFTMVVENSFFWDSIYGDYGKIAQVQSSEVFADGAQSVSQTTSVAIAKQQCVAPGYFSTEDPAVFADCSNFPRSRQPVVKKCGNNYIFARAVGRCLHLSLPGILKNDLGYHMGRSSSDPLQAVALPLAVPPSEFPGMSFNCPAFGFVPFGADDRFFMECKGVGIAGALRSCPFGYFFCPRRLHCILGQDLRKRPEFKQNRAKGFPSSGGSPLWSISQCVNEGVHSYPDYRFYYVCQLSPNSASFLPPKLHQCPPGLFYNRVYRLCTKASAFQIFNYDFEWRNVHTARSISQKMDLRSGISVQIGSIPFSIAMSDKAGKFATIDPRYYYISARTPEGLLGVRLFVCHSGFFFSSKLGHCVPGYLQENVLAANSYKYGVNIAEKANIVLQGRELLGLSKPAAVLLAIPAVGPMQVLTNWRIVFGTQADRSAFYLTLAPCTASGVYPTPDYRFFFTCVDRKGKSGGEDEDNEEEEEDEADADGGNEGDETEEEEEYEQILYQCLGGLYFSASTGFCVGSYYHSNIGYGRWEKYAWDGNQLKITETMTSEGMMVSEENIPWIVPACGALDGMVGMRDPRYYVRCRGGQRSLYICPTNTYFNRNSQSCKPISTCDCWEDVGLPADPAPKVSNSLPGMDLEVQIILDRSYLQVLRKVLETLVARTSKTQLAHGKDSALISRLICFWRDMETQRTLRFPNKFPANNTTTRIGSAFPNSFDNGVREVRSYP